MLQHPPYRVLGIGGTCIDLLIPVSEEFLAQIPGEKGGSDHISIEDLNRIKEKIDSKPILSTGGSSANMIKGLANLGESCGLISLIGKDPLGDHIVDYMNNIGVTGLFTKSLFPTTQVLCFITPDGQRTMRFYKECYDELAEEFLHSKYFKNVKLTHFAAYSLHNANLVEIAMQLSRDTQATISLDLSSFEIIRKFNREIKDLLTRYVDIVFANKDEAFALLGLSPEEGCLKLQEMCSIAVVMIGDKGCLVGHRGKVMHVPGFPIRAIDTTGAGDYFASGFLYGYLRGYPLDKCASMGNRLAKEIVAVHGTDLPLEKWAELRELYCFNTTGEEPIYG